MFCLVLPSTQLAHAMQILTKINYQLALLCEEISAETINASLCLFSLPLHHHS